jgi:hypothetical protein
MLVAIATVTVVSVDTGRMVHPVAPAGLPAHAPPTIRDTVPLPGVADTLTESLARTRSWHPAARVPFAVLLAEMAHVVSMGAVKRTLAEPVPLGETVTCDEGSGANPTRTVVAAVGVKVQLVPVCWPSAHVTPVQPAKLLSRSVVAWSVTAVLASVDTSQVPVRVLPLIVQFTPPPLRVIVPAPSFPAAGCTLSATSARVKKATTCRAACRLVSVQVVPCWLPSAHWTPQPKKRLSGCAAAVNVTFEPATKSAEHVPVTPVLVTVQLTPLGALVTVPVPGAPPDTTDTAYRRGV